MKQIFSLLLILSLIGFSSFAQEGQSLQKRIAKKWIPIEITDQEEVLTTFGKEDHFSFYLKDHRFIQQLDEPNITTSGVWRLRADTLVLEYDLQPVSSRVDSVVYEVKKDQPAIIYYKDGVEITRLTNERLESEKIMQKYLVEKISPDTLILTNNDQKLILGPDDAAKTALAEADGGFGFKSLYRGIIGLLTVLLLAYIMSSNRKSINWKLVLIGLVSQIIIAIAVLKIEFVQNLIEFVGQMFIKVLDFTKVGSEFLFGGFLDASTYGFIFAFQILPTIIFFSALTSVFFYYGIIQKIVYGLAWILTRALKISGAEGLSAAGNIFLGQTESPLLIKEYLPKMNRSEIMLVMIGGMATIAGGVLAIYIGLLGGDDPVERLVFAKHLITASVMAAPGAVVASKILVPQTQPIESEIKITREKIGSNILEAITNGTGQGLRLAVNVAAMLLVFLAFIAMLNYILFKIGDWTDLNVLITQVTNGQFTKFSLEFLLGYIFTPIAWAIGVPAADMTLVAQLFGEKIILNEMIAYISLKEFIDTMSFTHEKSVIIATYILCGFANFSSIGIQIGGIGSLAPGKRTLLSQLGFRALIGGGLASLLSATIVGMILG